MDSVVTVDDTLVTADDDTLVTADTTEENVASRPPEESLITRVKAATRASTGCCDFIGIFLAILYSSTAFTISILLLLPVPVSMVLIGSVYADACPGGRMIPVYLIVGGLVSLVKLLVLFIGRTRESDKSDSKNMKSTPYDAILNCFLFAWFIAGNVWIYRWPKDCHTVVFMYAFFLTLATYLILLILGCCICCGAGMTYLVTSSVEKGEN